VWYDGPFHLTLYSKIWKPIPSLCLLCSSLCGVISCLVCKYNIQKYNSYLCTTILGIFQSGCCRWYFPFHQVVLQSRTFCLQRRYTFVIMVSCLLPLSKLLRSLVDCCVLSVSFFELLPCGLWLLLWMVPYTWWWGPCSCLVLTLILLDEFLIHSAFTMLYVNLVISDRNCSIYPWNLSESH